MVASLTQSQQNSDNVASVPTSTTESLISHVDTITKLENRVQLMATNCSRGLCELGSEAPYFTKS